MRRVSESELRQTYEDSVGRFGTPAERRVSHILIELPPDADEETLAEAESTASALAERARSGEDFAALAAEYSDDAGSANSGGDLGIITPGAMVQPFEEAVFSMQQTDEVAGPVRTRFGLHVIKMTEFSPADVSPFEEVKAELEQELRRQYAEQRYLELADRFSNTAYEQPESLDPVAEELQLELQTTEWFSRDEGQGIAANPRFRQAAFSEDVKLEGLNSEAFEIDGSMLVSVSRLEVRDQRQLSLDEVRAEVEAELRRERRSEAAAERGLELVEMLNSGTSWDDLVAEQGLVSAPFEGARDDALDVTSEALVREIFSLPSGGLPKAGGTSLASGDFLLYQLDAVTDGDPATADESRRQAVRQLLTQRRGNELYAGYQDALLEGADVNVIEDQL